MSGRMQNYRNKVSDGFNDWKRLVANPYIAAYDTAYTRYNDTLKAQKDADRERAELFVASAGIVTGTVLMATVATSSLRVLAARRALSVVCNNNLTRVFNAMHTASQSKPFMFAVGKLLDEGKSRLGKTVQDAVTSLVTTNSSVVTNTPVVQLVHLDTFLRNHMACAIRVGDAIDADPALSEGEKDRAFALLRQAPIAGSPSKALDENRLADLIELFFWMNLILASDTLIDWPAQSIGSSGMATAMGAKSRPIDAMPSDRRYPRPAPARPGMLGTPTHQSIGYDRPGSVIRERIDKVHTAVAKKPFYQSYGLFGWGEPDGRQKGQELAAAETVLAELARKTQPTSIYDVNI